MAKYITYLRVSTTKQGHDGLGIGAQRAAVQQYLARRDHDLLAEYIEVESGRNADRPELAKALAQAKRNKATLVIARLDRLARSVAFISTMMEAGVAFLACDMVDASPLTLHIMAAVAEAEAKAISQRTRAAMQAAKARGIQLGNSVNLAEAQQIARQAIIKKADDRATTLLPIIRQIVAGGENSLHRVADRLNEMGIRTARNGSWHGTTVSNMLARCGFDGLAGLAAAV